MKVKVRRIKANDLPGVGKDVLTYEQKVELFIRERYSVNEELAILRQRDTKQQEFNEYFAYVEDCKQRAKGE